MTVHSNAERIRRYVDQLNARNFAVLDELVADTISVRSLHRQPASPLQQLSRAQYADAISGRLDAFPDYHVEVVDAIGEGDRIVVVWRSRGTHTGVPFLGVPATGRQLAEVAITIYRFEDGRIVDVAGYWDNADTWQQLGLIPPTDEILGQ